MELAVEPKTVLRQAVEKLRGAIVSGVFKPGQRLVETDLCEKLRVSRPSLREALRVLETEKLIVIAPNRGPFVVELTWAQAQEIYLVRALLEGEASALCARNATDDDIARMQTALNAFAAATAANDSEGRIRYTAEFYDALQRASGNQTINEVLQGLVSRINVLRVRSMARGDRASESLREMTAIFAAIVARDPDAARQASMEHINNAAIAAEAAFHGR
ncbi:GntR family transcriptional regulator [Ruixingdingia sedimenti]|uniref:GntR family transcriptional regulator n=1 Tax=Ruixingdingia sedimenti TaxID=3073604 RepID=A0ABU1FAE9_9RHOB|nr:GntR family transcriptional regulator [Xinfangfangia sp. LG-4]MDR5653409.1 GntR family transcriptional regulator [Xinfangfangia sp. LG-4]